MDDKYQDKYRIESTRLSGYDYSQPGAYFVTICTKNRENYFGAVADGKMVLSDMGIIADYYWREIPEHFRMVQLDEFVIMPNHVHGIIIIVSPAVETLHATSPCIAPSPPCYVSTCDMSKISPKPGSLSAVVRSYKSACSRAANIQFPDLNFGWQTRFYDHIVRDDDELNRIREYIYYNLINWEKDDLFLL